MRTIYVAFFSDGTIREVHATREELVENAFEYADKVHAATGVKLVCFYPLGPVDQEQTTVNHAVN